MAEQEVCANEVSRTMSTEQEIEDDKTSVQGESLLLPLLQELLDKKGGCAAPLNRSCSSHSSDGSVTAAADSGTESGEDLRLLAAGLCDSAELKNQNIEPLGPGLLGEVHNALARLAVSLQLDTCEVEMDPVRKTSLLELVKRLQASLVIPARPPVDPKQNANKRFSKKPSRQHRYTVGVSSEELAAARKLVEEVVLRENMGVTADTKEPDTKFTLQKQLSDGNVASNSHNYASLHVQNTVPKPFMCNSPVDIHSYKLVKNIIDSNKTDGKSDLEAQDCNTPFASKMDNSTQDFQNQKNILDSISVDSNKSNDTQDNFNMSTSVMTQPTNQDTEYLPKPDIEEDPNTFKIEDVGISNPLVNDEPPQIHYVTDIKTVETILLPDQRTYDGINNFDSTFNINQENYQLYPNVSSSTALKNDSLYRRRNNDNKKLKMKRSNTIDIPKPANYFIHDEEVTDSVLDAAEQPPRNSYLALRGPIRVGNSVSTIVPSFEPKTENDKKFMAFLQKQNKDANINSLWHNKNSTPKYSSLPEQNWNRKFGNIKTVFENQERKSSAPAVTFNSAKKFWQTADNQQNVQPKSMKDDKKNIQKGHEQTLKQQAKLPWASEQNKVVTGSLRVESVPQNKNIQNNQLVHGKHYKFIPQPLPVNKFSHAPMSAFKPPQKKTLSISTENLDNSKHIAPEPGTPLFLYSPKQPNFPEATQEVQKQVQSPPWVSNQSEHRVLNMVASKFENTGIKDTPIKDTPVIKPKSVKSQPGQKSHHISYKSPKTDSDNIQKPFTHDIHSKTVNNRVRRLSGEYDNKAIKQKLETQKDTMDKHEHRRKLSGDYSNVSKNINNRKSAELTNAVKQKSNKPVKEPHQEFNNQRKKIIENESNAHVNVQPAFNVNYNENPNEYYYNTQNVGNFEPQYKPNDTHTAYGNIYYDEGFQSKPNIISDQVPPLHVIQNVNDNTSIYNKTKDEGFVPLMIYNNTTPKMEEHAYIPSENQFYNPVANVNTNEAFYDEPKFTSEFMLADRIPNSSEKFATDSQIHDAMYRNPPESEFMPQYQTQTYVTSEPKVIHKTYDTQLNNEANYYPKEAQVIHFKDNIGNYDSPIMIQQSPEKTLHSPMFDTFKKSPVTVPDSYQFQPENVQPEYQIYNKVEHKNTQDQPPTLLKIFDYSSSEQSPVSLTEMKEPATPPLTEYKAVSKVMTGPVSQQAITVSQNTPKRREEHDNAARNLQTILQKRSSPKDPENRLTPSPKPPSKETEQTLLNRRSVSPQVPNSFVKKVDFKDCDKQQFPKAPEIHINNKTIASESYEINDDGQTIVSTKLQIPVDSKSIQQINKNKKPEEKIQRTQLSPSYALSKSDSWHQLVQDQQFSKKHSPRPSPRASPECRQALQKAKSSHSLAIPKQFEAGISKDEIEQKKKTVQAYFSSSQPLTKVSSSTNVQKEQKKVSSKRFAPKVKSSPLSRSKTMPDVTYANLLDDIDDVDAEFENIFKASIFK